MEILDPDLAAIVVIHRWRCRMNIEIDRYLRRTGMTKAALSRHALGDGCALRSITEGRRSLTEYTEKRLRRFMLDHPDGVSPGRVGRPPRGDKE